MIKVQDYTFKNDNLIQVALTHSSYSPENYERLEFLGDSILDFVVAKYFYQFKDKSEGYLTKARSHFVALENLSKVFDKLNIEHLVKIGKSCQEVTKSMKCDMFEAVVAAIYLDSNLTVCEKFILDNIFTENIDQIELIDDKSKLQEYVQLNKMNVSYTLLQQKGEAHNLTFVIKGEVGNIWAVAEGNSKLVAEQKVAKIILEELLKEKK